MLFTLSDVKSPRGSGISGVSGCLGRSGHSRPARSRPLSLSAWSGQKFPRAVAAHCTAVCTTTTSPSPENQLTSSFNKNFRQLSKFHKNIFFHVFFFIKKKWFGKNAVKSTDFERTLVSFTYNGGKNRWPFFEILKLFFRRFKKNVYQIFVGRVKL